MLTRSEVLNHHGDLASLRAPEEADWQDLFDLLDPTQDVLSKESRRTRYEELFDPTQMYALDAYVGGIFGQLSNPVMRWFELGIDDPDLLEFTPVKEWLYGSTSLLLRSLDISSSNFYPEISAFYADMGITGLATLYQEEDLGRGRILDRCISINQTYIDDDAFGFVSVFHNVFQLKGNKLLQMFPNTPRVDEKRTYQIIHRVMETPDSELGRHDAKPFYSIYVSPDLDTLEKRGGYYEFPYHVGRWKKRHDTPYASGPGHIARPDMTMLQEMERTHIVAANRAADPTLLAHSESDIRITDITPGAVLYGAVNESGKPLLQALDRAQNLQLSMNQSEQRRAAIRQAFYFDLMQFFQRKEATATEFLGIQEEKLRLMGPNLIRVQSTLSSFIGRRYRLLERAGQLPPPPPEMAGKSLQVVYQSPLAKAQQSAQARIAMQFANGVAQLAQYSPDALDRLNVDATIAVLHDGLGAPPSVMTDLRMAEQTRQQRAQRQMQMEELAKTQTAVSIAAEASHAQQAASAAKGRAQA